MENRNHKIINDTINKASKHLQTANERLKSYNSYSEAIESAQECIELSVKSILSLLSISYPLTHGWEQSSKEFIAIAKQIQEKRFIEKLTSQNLIYSVPLPRLIFLFNFWSQFYLTAKYGLESGNLASAQDLFHKEEAELAVKHADECYRAASQLIVLDKEILAAIINE